ncbi:MAG: hypothetical protein ABJE63_13985 [Lentilitoribacter sp.]
MALEDSGCDQASVVQKPRLLSDNRSSYISEDLADYINNKGEQYFYASRLKLVPIYMTTDT